jgi:hypothetical protein
MKRRISPAAACMASNKVLLSMSKDMILAASF